MSYVSMGSSFASGPGVGRRAPGSPRLAMRSDRNYARLVAASTGMALTDVSWSGAVVDDLLNGGPRRAPRQVDALGQGTRLVTVTVGGNDLGFIGSLWAWTCASGRFHTPLAWRLAGVGREPEQAPVTGLLDGLQVRLSGLVEEIRRRAPAAQVVLLDYPTVLPDRQSPGTDVLPIAAEQWERASALETGLARVVEKVAADAGATFVSARAVTQGHDVCAAEPWISGYVHPPTPLHFGEIPFHPTERAMQAVATAIVAALD